MAESSDNGWDKANQPQALPEEPDEPQFDTVRSSAATDARLAASTELARLRRNYSLASHPSRTQDPATKKPSNLLEQCVRAVKRAWRHQVSIIVDHETCRDHLALERTFLGRLQHAPTPSPFFGFYVLGKPLSGICQGAAIYTLIIGAFRTWRSQNAIVRGKAISGGFEIVALAAGVLIVSSLPPETIPE
ncbi:uncharacterized protein PAC_05106 [Phialocephala subalpina]|uniref:DUF202 domain-containing protein n=1 Tax=Phialocephala subalpina TaxID=576137 RepID=A0A1L7WR16_9HELO|nr:uncharacterized protein PAC_05106 [Phialocephala subalpina]